MEAEQVVRSLDAVGGKQVRGLWTTAYYGVPPAEERDGDLEDEDDGLSGDCTDYSHRHQQCSATGVGSDSAGGETAECCGC